MNALLPQIALLFIIATFIIAICAGIYILGTMIKDGLHGHKAQVAIDNAPSAQRNLRAAYLFFGFIGVLGLSIGAWTYIQEPDHYRKTIPILLSAFYFLILAWQVFRSSKKVTQGVGHPPKKEKHEMP